MSSAEAVCALVDPFCLASRGVLWPDDTSTATLPIHYEALYPVTTDGAGSLCMQIFPQFNKQILTSVVAAGTATFAAAETDANSAFASWMTSNVTGYRIVNFGVEFTPTTTMTQSEGFYVMEDIQSTIGVNGTLATPDINSPYCAIQRMAGGKMTWIARPKGPLSRTFTVLNTSGTTQTNAWSNLAFHISGSHLSTAVGVLRIAANIEVQIIDQLVIGNAARSATEKPRLLAAAGTLSSKTNAVHVGGTDSLAKSLMDKAMGFGLGKVEQFFDRAFGTAGPGGRPSGRLGSSRYQSSYTIEDAD